MTDWIENSLGEMPCKPFDMVDVWFRDGDLSSGFASDFYWKIDHDIADIIKYRVRDNKTETPEEKEAFDGMANDSESPNISEWKRGDECVINRKSINGELLSDVGTYYGETNSHYWLHGIGGLDSSDKSGNIYCKSKYWLSKPETPQQREERELLEAAYDLYCNAQHAVDVIGYDSFGVFKSDKVQVKFWLSIVDKTGYRKAK